MHNNKTVCRVVHIISDLSVGGTEMMLYKLLAHTDRRQFQPIVIALNAKGELSERISAHGIPVYVVNMQVGISLVWQLLRLAWLLMQLKPNLIQGWMYLGNIAATLANSILGNRYSVIWNIRQSAPPASHLSFAMRRLLQWGARLSPKAVQIIYDTKANALKHQALGYAGACTKIIPNGFDTHLFRPNTYTRRLVRQELAIPSNSIVIGMIAHYSSTSQHELFIQAAGELNKHYKQSKPLYFILAGWDVTLNNIKLTTLKTQSGLTKQLYLLGERRDIPALLNALDIFTLTSTEQAFPHIIGEAMASGLFCVMPKIDYAECLLNEGVYILEHFTFANLAAVWDQWLKADDNTHQSLSQRAINCIQHNFPINQITHDYQTLYQEIRAPIQPIDLLLPLGSRKHHSSSDNPV